MRYLRSVDYCSAAGIGSRRWRAKFHARFLRFWAWACRQLRLQPLPDLVAEFHALGQFPPQDGASASRA